jgi:hypothetical protein
MPHEAQHNIMVLSASSAFESGLIFYCEITQGRSRVKLLTGRATNNNRQSTLSREEYNTTNAKRQRNNIGIGER